MANDPLPTLEYQPTSPPSRAVQWRFAVWVCIVATLFGGGLTWIGFLFTNGYALSGATLFVGWIGLGLTVVAMAGLLATTPADAIKLKPAMSGITIFAGSAILHIACLVVVTPELSEDGFRYRYDARMAAAGYSPYEKNAMSVLVPSSTRHEAGIDLLTRHAEFATIYPPTAQGVFRLANYLGPKLRPHGSTWYPLDTMVSWKTGMPRRHAVAFSPAMRLLATIASLLTTAVLLGALSTMGRSPWYAALFAWNPLTLIETAGQSHVDIFGVLFVAVALWLALRGWMVFAMIPLAVAAGVKPHVVALAPVITWMAMYEFPLLVLREGVRRRAKETANPVGQTFLSAIAFHAMRVNIQRGGLCVVLFLFTLAPVYAPLLFNPNNFRGWYETVQVYSASWEANGSVYELATAPFRNSDGKSLESAKRAARIFGALGFVATLYLVLRKRLPPADAAYWLILTPLLLAPVVYPWYLSWGLAVVPLLQRSRGWTLLVWAATSVLSYQLLREPVWRLPAAWWLVEYVPVYAALILELRSMARSTNCESYAKRFGTNEMA